MTQSQPDNTPPTPKQPEPSIDFDNDIGSIRETLESIVIAFVLAFVFRAFIVEAFVIPTGSMAPTLLGQHQRQLCPQCGYRFTVGPGVLNEETYGLPDDNIQCPMCFFPMHVTTKQIANSNSERFKLIRDSGDRILVLKSIYVFSDPKRWDVVVFKNPQRPDYQSGPADLQNYIKRLVGLPGEELWIVNGDVFTRQFDPATHEPTEPWQIQRKPLGVQNTVWQHIYNSDYFPRDAHPDNQPLTTPESPAVESPRNRPWTNPWQIADPSNSPFTFDTQGPRWHYDSTHDTPARLDFDFSLQRDENYFSYNQLGSRSKRWDSSIQDFRLGADITPHHPGLEIVIQLSNANLHMRARIEPTGKIILDTQTRDNQPLQQGVWNIVAETQINPLNIDRATHVELAHVDQRLALTIAGELVADWPYPQDPESETLQRPLLRAPIARIGLRGADATLRSAFLDRDLYYTGAKTRATYEPVRIEADRFFCMGDNSPDSLDGRGWTSVDQWVTQITTHPDDPLNNQGVPPGFVPRQLMIGRAFFVYYPAPWRLIEGKLPIVPNFGAMRFIR